MPSQSEWESQKDVIRDLYLDQNYTLKALQERMNSTGFIATKSQYETKFKAWGFSKNSANIPAATWKHVGYKVAKRKRENEDSIVFFDGALVDQKRLRKEISRYSYSITEKIELENIGAPSPPGPLTTVATPPSSQETFTISPWPENLPWLAFVRSLNTGLASLHEPHEASRASQQGQSTPQSKAQHVFSSPNTDISILGSGRKSTYIITRRDRLELIQSILPHSSDSNRAADIHNSMSLLSTTSNHWALKLLIYLASNNLLKRRDLPNVWRLVEETGVKGWTNLSKSLELGETSLKAAMEYLFEAGIWAHHLEIVSWLLDLGFDANKQIIPYLANRHLPLVIAMETKDMPMVRLLLLKGASPLLRCCEFDDTATHFAIFDPRSEAESLELFLQAVMKTQSCQPDSRFKVNTFQDDGAQSNNCEGQRSEDETFLKLELLVDMLEKSFASKSPPWATLASPKALIKAVRRKNHNLIRIIHKLGVPMNSYVDGGHYYSNSYPLDWALRETEDSTSTVKLLLELGASPNYNPGSEWKGTCSRALNIAVRYSGLKSRAELIRTLIEHGAAFRGSVECGNESHPNLIDSALEDIEEICLERRADDSSSDLEVESACMDMEALEALHDAGLPLPETSLILIRMLNMVYEDELRNKNGDTERFDALVRFLALKATDFTLRSENGWTALDYTMFLGMKEAGELMFEKGAVHSRKFVHEYCFSNSFAFGKLETILSRVSTSPNEEQKRSWLFYRAIGTMRTGDLSAEDTLAASLGFLLQDYCELPSSPKHEAYIILQACLTRNLHLIELALKYLPNGYSPIALDELIWYHTQTRVDHWKFIEDLLRRRSNTSSPLQKLQERRLFLRVTYSELTGEGDPKVLEWFHRYEKEAFDLANLHSSALLMDALYIHTHCDAYGDDSWVDRYRQPSDFWDKVNSSQLCKHGLKASTYLGLLMVAQGQHSQLSVLLHHGMHLDRRFPWSLTMLQFAVAREDLIMSRKLLEAGANVNARAPWRDIPEPIRNRIPKSIRDSLTDHSRWRAKRRTAFQLAVEQGNLPMIRLLLEFGVDVNEPPARVGGATALQLACIKGFIDIVGLLIQEGANVNAAGAEYFGRTALEGAAEHGRLDIVFVLLGRGCFVHDSFRKQYTRAVGFARARAYHTVATELQKYGNWTDEDEDVLRGTDLRDTQPKTRDLEEELEDDEEVSEIDPEEFLPEDSDLFPPEMFSESEPEEYESSSDDEDEVMSPNEGFLQAQVNEVGDSQQATEPSNRQLDTWDDLIEYDGDDEEI
ncbi:hypothetical protein E8E14_013540 [Neopestalotiopsis sp. 37M]|nr:hypothetical protein E8E14_013540 [Neopestalotiopsis sp. 37M]